MKPFFQIRFPYDLSFVKAQVERLSERAFVQIALIMTVAMVGYFLLGKRALLLWGGGYALSMLAWVWLIKAMPEKVERAGFLLVMGASGVYGLSYVWIVWYSWISPEELMRHVAIAALSGAMLNAISMRSDDILMGLTDMVLTILTAIWMVVYFFMGSGLSREDIFFAVVIGALLLFLLAGIYDANAARNQLRRSHRTEIEQTKLQALGQLTGGVAHDFNNLLTVIIGNLDLRREVDLEREDEEELLAEVEAAARKASVLTAHLLAFSRRSPLEERVVDLQKVVEEARVLLGRLLPATHQFMVRSPSSLPPIRVDVGKLETVIVNLVMNARDAMPAGGMIVFSAAEVDFSDGRPLPASPYARTGRALEPGRYLELSVADEGAGIPVDVLPKVLEPYFTTKPVGKGSGLGLPMALGFAEQSGGTLSVESAEGQGTRVSLWFPVAEPEEAAAS